MKTDLKFTQTEVRLMVCLLTLHPTCPFAVEIENWRDVRDRLLTKFLKIDRRFTE